MDLPEAETTRTRPPRSGRPSACPRCRGATWWDGWRQVFPQLAEGRVERWLARAKCKQGCPSFVDGRPGELYPHRQYQPDVVAGVVAAVALGGEPASKAVTSVRASPTSARRWTGWVAKLVSVASALALAEQLWPDGVAGAGLAATPASSTSKSAVAARVLHALEYLGEALVRSGVVLVSTSGLGRLLEWQHRLHGDVVHLVTEPSSFSPAMALGQSGGPL
jgi:hypothetical protein